MVNLVSAGLHKGASSVYIAIVVLVSHEMLQGGVLTFYLINSSSCCSSRSFSARVNTSAYGCINYMRLQFEININRVKLYKQHVR